MSKKNIIISDNGEQSEKEDIKIRPKKSMELIFNSVLAVSFLVFIVYYFYQNAFLFPRGYGFGGAIELKGYRECDDGLKAVFRKVEDDFNRNFHRRLDHIPLYGSLNRMLGRTVLDDAVADRSIVKGAEGVLYYAMPKYVDTAPFVSAFVRLRGFLEEREIPFVYLQAPNKHMKNSCCFPKGVMDYSNEVSTDFINRLAEQSVPTLDMDRVFADSEMDERGVFYMTDNHWNIHGAFAAYVELIRYLEMSGFGDKLVDTERTTDLKQYELRTWKNAYIGSQGRRAGIGYSEIRDDFEMLFPKQSRRFTFLKSGVAGEVILSRQGSFRDVFFFGEYLEKEDIYQEKYTVFMGEGTAEELIQNEELRDSDAMNVLIIKDSFAMPVAGFLSQNCASVHMI
ncbi:MAG: hypothetical protein Q4A41_05745, partial [Bacillota bacterium]|nr:hypothetical protein [Bacillota bacterium]